MTPEELAEYRKRRDAHMYDQSWATNREREAEKMGKSTVRSEGPVGFILAAIGIVVVLVSFLSWFFFN
jgi:succinyl-CoA synthetase beta subunit